MDNGHTTTIVDIFCGCGGLSNGFKQAGFKVVYGVDYNESAIATFNKYHDNVGTRENVENIDAEDIFRQARADTIDVLAGGPPCQAFSTLAVAKWRSLGKPSTITHPMNKLYKEFLRLVREVRPKFFL